jgi:hypothetical protein
MHGMGIKSQIQSEGSVEIMIQKSNGAKANASDG